MTDEVTQSAEATPEDLLKYRTYYLNLKEKQRLYYLKNREKALAYSREYRRKNSTHYKEWYAKRKAKRLVTID